MKTYEYQMLKKIMIAMFAGPAALGVLAKLDERLDFTPLIERIILNFKVLSHAFWYLIEDMTGVHFSQYDDLLTIMLLLLLPVVYQFIMSLTSSKKSGADTKPSQPTTIEVLDNKKEWTKLYEQLLYVLVPSVFFMCVFTLFELDGLWVALILPGMAIHYITKIFRDLVNSHTKIEKFGKVIDLLSWFGALLFLFPLLVKIVLMKNNAVVYEDINWLIVGVIGLLLSWLLFRASDYCAVTITNVALWVVGVLTVNWVVTILIPSIEVFLESANV